MEFMDRSTFDSLDFQYILDKIDVKTPYGQIYKKKIRAFLPGEEELLREELNKIERLLSHIDDEFIGDINYIFHNIKDIKNSIKRASEGISLTEMELFEIKSFLFSLKGLERLLKERKIKDYNIRALEELEEMLDPENTGICTFYIYDGYSEELRRIRKDIRDAQAELQAEKRYLKEKIEDEVNVKLSPDGTITIPKYKVNLIKRIKANPNLVYRSENYLYVKYSLKKTESMIILENKLSILKKKEEREEEKVRRFLTNKVKDYSRDLWQNISGIGRLDLILAKAKLARDLKGVKPNIVSRHVLHIKRGRHPKIEEILNKKGLKFTPISVNLKEGVTVITGANMGGKTVSLKLIGLLVSMAQHGLFVPAEEMTLGLNSFIKSSMGDFQSIDRGLSTFGSEIVRIKEATDLCHKKGLILMDELAKGTNPREGYAISKALVEYFKDKNSITIMTTHYDNIVDKDVLHLQVAGLSNIDFNELEKRLMSTSERLDILNSLMNHELIEAKESSQVPQDAINIAKILGLKAEIIDLAQQYLR